MKTKQRMALCLCLCLMILLSLMPSAVFAAEEAQVLDGALSADYIDENGNKKVATSYQHLSYIDKTNVVLSGWYLLDANVTFNERITVSGEAHLILCDGRSLTALGGIELAEGNTLSIYEQSDGGGSLIARGGASAAGIGSSSRVAGGTLVVNGGTVMAYGGDHGAGIGGGYYAKVGNVTINGGEVVAEGGDAGAGIGGGSLTNGGNVTINGGTVNATGGQGGAGIGGGGFGRGGTITINGGSVMATGGRDATGIGGGTFGSGGSVTITGGTVTAVGTVGKFDEGVFAAIGTGGSTEHSGSLTIPDDYSVTAGNDADSAVIQAAADRENSTHTLSYAFIAPCTHPDTQPVDENFHVCNCCNSGEMAHIFNGGGVCSACGYDRSLPVPYIDESGEEQTVDCVRILDAGTTLTTGWYVVDEYITISDRISVSGVVNLILCDDARLNAQQGINVGEGNTLNIYVQKEGTGWLMASGTSFEAAIGGGYEENAGVIVINGGTISAYGKNDGAGIGGGRYGDGGAVTVNAGRISATGGTYGAGIGGGYNANGGTITINGGEVNVTGGTNGAGIGGGERGNGGTITITGGTVEARGYRYGAGIGGGNEGDGGAVTITGGVVTTIAGTYGEGGIGAGEPRYGQKPNYGSLTVVNGIVYGGYSSNPTKVIVPAEGAYERPKYMVVKPAPDPEFRTHSLVLSGEIGVNFFMELVEGVNYADSYMEFTVNGVTTRDDFDPDDRDLNGHGYYGFTCYVNSVQMAEPITAVFHFGGGRTIEQTYSVKDYITAYEAVAASFDETTTALVHALADYGHYAQPALAEANLWTVGVDYAAMDVCYTASLDYDAAASAVSQYALRRDTGRSEVAAINFTLNLLSQTEMRVLFTMDKQYSGSIAVTVDGAAYTPVRQADGRYLVSIRNISAHQLGDSHEIVITTASGSATVTASAMSYVNAVLNPNQSANIRNAAAALYNYYKAAMDYRAANG